MSNSVQPHRRQPIRLPHPWDSPGRNTGVGCHFLLQCEKVESEGEVTQLCPTLCDPMDCSLPGSSIHGIFQARVLEWVVTGRTHIEAEAPILWPPDTVYSLEKILMLGKIEGKKRKGQQRMRWLDSITASVNMNLSKLLEIVGDRWTWHAADHRLQRAGHDLATEQQQIHL